MPQSQYPLATSQPNFLHSINQQYELSNQPLSIPPQQSYSNENFSHQSILPWHMSQYNNLAMRVANNSAMQQPFNNLQSQTNVQPYPYWNGRFL